MEVLCLLECSLFLSEFFSLLVVCRKLSRLVLRLQHLLVFTLLLLSLALLLKRQHPVVCVFETLGLTLLSLELTLQNFCLQLLLLSLFDLDALLQRLDLFSFFLCLQFSRLSRVQNLLQKLLLLLGQVVKPTHHFVLILLCLLHGPLRET